MVGVLLGWLFPSLFKGVDPQYYDTVRILLPLMVVNVWLTAVAAIYSSVLAAHDRFDVARGVDIVVLVLRTVGTVYVLERGWGLWGLVTAVSIGNVCAVLGNRIYAGRVHEGLRSFPFFYSKVRLGELLRYGIPAAISNSSVKIIGQSDLVIVGLALSVSAVREYSVGSMIIIYSATFVRIINRTFFPSIQKSVARGFDGEAKHLFFRQLRVSLIAGIFVFVGYFFYSESFIKLWMFQDNFGLSSVESSASIMSILAAASIPLLFTHPCRSYLSAIGYVKFNATISIIEAFLNLIFSIVFVFTFGWGLGGVAFGTLVSRLLVPSILIPYHLAKNAKITVSKFISIAVFPGISSGIMFSSFCFLLLKIWPPESWMAFFVHIIILLTVWLPIVYVCLLPEEYKGILSKRIKSAT